MDLRKAILLKQPLQDSSFSSLNNSTASVYESAAEDSDNSLYYSFVKSPMKDFDSFISENSQDPDASLVSEVDDKENTVIMKHIQVMSSPEEEVKKAEIKTSEPVKEVEKMEIDESIIIENKDIKEQASGHEDQKDSNNTQMPEISNNLPKKNLIIPTIMIEDPNENLVNPFTMEEVKPSTPMETSLEGRESIETDNVTKRKVQTSAKKSASKIPMRTHLYSPIQRNSLDKKSKINLKPVITRRTIYETRSAVIQKPKSQPVIQPAKSKMTAPKPMMHKCTTVGCLREFRTVSLLEQHKKTHNPSTTSTASSSTHSSFKCKWCDKIFELNNALTSHMIDKCTKISFSEKRKLMSQQEKSNQTANDNKRRTVFVAPPVPKKRSPRRQTLNKSGIMITPKKTLKCECGRKFTDVLEFANHTISHKYENALKQKPT